LRMKLVTCVGAMGPGFVAGAVGISAWVERVKP